MLSIYGRPMKEFPSVFESIKDLSFDQINGLLILADNFKKQADSAPYFSQNKPIIATSFLENSTRTKHSFSIAAQKLGAIYIDFNAETSSLKKGETLEETLLTLKAQGVDLTIIRTSVSNELSQFREKPPIRIVNGGDGMNQHPTQALLDLFTLMQTQTDNLEGKTLTIIGDCIHSRVGNSLIDLLPQFGIKVLLNGPSECLPQNLQGIEIEPDTDKAIIRSDFIYLLRIQKERHTNTSKDIFQDYETRHGISIKRLKKLNKDIPVLHPGPCNIGVEISKDIMRSNNYLGYEQVKNSIYMRMAIIVSILSNSDKKVGLVEGIKSPL